MTHSVCRCGRPLHDAYFCQACADDLSRALGDVTWLAEELETTITKRRGLDYRRVGGGKGGSKEQPSPPEWTASNARDNLRNALMSWVLFCHDEQVRNSSPHPGLPAHTIVAMSRFLLWRVDGLALHDIGPEAVEEITSAVAHCHRLIDRPADRQYLGTHDCGGQLYARPGGSVARCNECGANINADELRTKLLADLDDRLVTAREAAELSTYLGLKANRDQVRKRVERWGASGKVTRHPINGQDHYRFGPLYVALAEHESKTA